jgi:hydroxyacylglutathione hydrolase
MINIQSFTFNPVQENTYVLYNNKDASCIIDPGCYFSNERKKLQDFIDHKNLAPKFLLNTHCHLDHVFGNKFIFDTYGLPLHLHIKEKPVLDYAPASGLNWGMPFENYQGELIFLEDGDLVKLGEDELQVLLTPGHSPGSICFYSKNQQFLIGGDVLFRQSIGRTDLPGGDPETLIQSIRTKLFVLPDEVIVYPGHGEPTTIGFERANNPFLKGLNIFN